MSLTVEEHFKKREQAVQRPKAGVITGYWTDNEISRVAGTERARRIMAGDIRGALETGGIGHEAM